MPECQGAPCSKQGQYLKFKWLQKESIPQPISLQTKAQPFNPVRNKKYIYRFHANTFQFSILLSNNGVREQWERVPSLLWSFFYGKCHSKSTWSQLCSKFFLNNYKAPWRWNLKDTLQLKILRTWINIGLEPASLHLAYYCMLLFLSNKPSF